MTTWGKADNIVYQYAKRLEKDEYPPLRREESRRLVKGGREGAGNITLERRAEGSRPLRTPPLPGSLSGRAFVPRQEEWYRRGLSPLSLWGDKGVLFLKF